MNYSDELTLKELSLKLPPLNTDADDRPAPTRATITYDHGAKQGYTTEVLITRLSFGFRFCFGNTYEHTKSFVVSAQIDNPSRPLRLWMPPHWRVVQSRGITEPYIIKAVSWDKRYQDRFATAGQQALYERLREKQLELL